MTNEEAKVFLDNLKICINEHPIVADWLVEIADRKTEPQIVSLTSAHISGDIYHKVEDEPQYHADVECNYKDCDNCGHKEYCPQSKTEPQIDIHDLTDCDFCKDRNCKDCEGGKNEPQTERRCGNCKFLTYRFNKTWCDIKCENPHDVVCDKWERSE